jgi:CarD family transcriptional regulator
METMKSPRRPASHANTKYKAGQEIVYPLQGVGHIERIEEKPFREKKLLYYIVYLEVTDMTIMVPVDKADDLGIRAIVGKKESQKALRLIAEDYEPVTADWKLRYQMNLDLLKKGSIIDIANVVRALYHRSRVKELPILERKLYDSALKLLVDEISFSLEKSKEDVEELVFARLKGTSK